MTDIQHDEGWLERRFAAYPYGSMDGPVAGAKDYHEHMQRWRSLDELPEDGQRIEVAITNVMGRQESIIIAYAEGVEFKFQISSAWQAVGWKPASPLPEVE